jgi:hypothetical protein
LHSRALLLLTIVFFGCGTAPITADTLDKDWVDAIGWPADETGEEGTTIITDPTGIRGELTADLSSAGCLVTWAIDGERTTCRDCEFAFDAALSVLEDTCGISSAANVLLTLNAGAVYVEYNRLAAYERIGNTITFDSLAESTGTPEPYYYGYYEYYYSFSYYGTLVLED